MYKRIEKTLMLSVLAGCALVFAGCKSGGSTGGSAADPTLAQPVRIVESASGNSAALKNTGAMLIRTREQYEQLGDKDLFPGSVDFDRYDLVIVALGEQPTSGYAVAITSLQQTGDELAVVGKASKPGPDVATAQVMTYPYEAVLIGNTSATTLVPYID